VAVLFFDSSLTLGIQRLENLRITLDSAPSLGVPRGLGQIPSDAAQDRLPILVGGAKPKLRGAGQRTTQPLAICPAPLIEITRFPRQASVNFAGKVGPCRRRRVPQSCGIAGGGEAIVIDPKGGKFRVAHDCGACGLSRRADLIWAAPRKGTRPGQAPKAATHSGVKP
jgi:hypothetical protein